MLPRNETNYSYVPSCWLFHVARILSWLRIRNRGRRCWLFPFLQYPENFLSVFMFHSFAALAVSITFLIQTSQIPAFTLPHSPLNDFLNEYPLYLHCCSCLLIHLTYTTVVYIFHDTSKFSYWLRISSLSRYVINFYIVSHKLASLQLLTFPHLSHFFSGSLEFCHVL